MLSDERKLQILDLSVTIVFSVVGCIIGKLILMCYGTWISFNAPAISVLAIGEIIWWRIRKKLFNESNR